MEFLTLELFSVVWYLSGYSEFLFLLILLICVSNNLLFNVVLFLLTFKIMLFPFSFLMYLTLKLNEYNKIHFWTYRLILTVCQPVGGYYKPRGLGCVIIVIIVLLCLYFCEVSDEFLHRVLWCKGSLNTNRKCPRGVMVKAMDCRIVVIEFVFQSCYYIHYRENTLGKVMNPLILPAMG